MFETKKVGNALLIILVVLAVAVIGLILYGRGNQEVAPGLNPEIPPAPRMPTTGGEGDTGPQFWFARDDYAIADPDDENQVAPFAADTLSKWDNPEAWSRALDAMDVYVMQSYLFNRGRPVADAFVELCLNYPKYRLDNQGDRVQQCYDEYLRHVLNVFNTYGIELAIHAGPSKGYVAENNPSGAPAETIGLAKTINLIARINRVGAELEPPYRVGYLKLQSMLSGSPRVWEGHGLANNVVSTISFMKGVQTEFPDIKFVLGDALFQQRTDEIEGRGGETEQTWRDAYRALKTALDEEASSPGGMKLNFAGLRIEWKRDWLNDPTLERDAGFAEMVGNNGVIKVVHDYGWKVGISHSAEQQPDEKPFDGDGSIFETRALMVGKRSLALGLDFDYVYFGNSDIVLFPETTVPEEPGPNNLPTQASIFLKLVELYD